MDLKLSVTGVEGVDGFFKILPQAFSHSVMQAAHAEAVRPMINRQHLLAPVGETGKTADSIGVIKTPFARAGVIGEIQEGPRRGRFGGNKAHFTEFGFKTRSKGKGKTFVPPKKWVEPGFDQTRNQVMAAIPTLLSIKLYQFIKRRG